MRSARRAVASASPETMAGDAARASRPGAPPSRRGTARAAPATAAGSVPLALVAGAVGSAAGGADTGCSCDWALAATVPATSSARNRYPGALRALRALREHRPFCPSWKSPCEPAWIQDFRASQPAPGGQSDPAIVRPDQRPQAHRHHRAQFVGPAGEHVRRRRRRTRGPSPRRRRPPARRPSAARATAPLQRRHRRSRREN